MNQQKIKELEEMIERDHSNMVGIIVQKNGKKLYENYFNGSVPHNAVHVYSVTKSIFSALIGIAVDKGFINSVEQKILDFFPDYKVKSGEKTIQSVTIKNLLTMTAPFKYEVEPYEEFFTSGNWITAALDLLGGEEYTGEFMYSPIIGAHILSGVLVKATGQRILDFAMENLFLPLDINVSHNIMLRDKDEHIAFGMKAKHNRGWAVDPQGINTASWGLTLTPEDMIKIGQLYLNDGVWNDKQLIPAGWIKESTTEHSRWGELSYGYLWWVINGNEHIYAAMGDGGNVIYVNSKKKTVVSIASLFTADTTDVIRLIQEQIEPIFES